MNEQSKRTNFFCQNVSGDVNFSIDEWNKAYQEVKDMSDDVQRLVLDSPPRCETQCFACMAVVGETRLKNSKL